MLIVVKIFIFLKIFRINSHNNINLLLQLSLITNLYYENKLKTH